MRGWARPLLSLVFWTGAASVIHANTWIDASNARFEIVTDAGEQAVRHLVTSLEQFDGAIAHSIGSSPAFGSPSGPVRIYLFKSEHEFAEFRDENSTAGVTLTLGEHSAPVIALFASDHARETAIHEYVHVLVRRGDWKLPHWFEEGLAEFYAHSTPLGREQLSVGQRVPEYLAQLKDQAITRSIFDDGRNPASRLRYYAASWALVHMILTDPRYQRRIEQLFLNGGLESSFPEMLNDLQAYLARPIWNQSTVLAPRASSPELAVKAINPLDAEFMLATLLLDAGRPDAARKRYKKIAEAHPSEAASAEASGLAAMASGQMDLARLEFRRAVGRQCTRARIWSELAMLDREAGAEWSAIRPLLERAAELDPSDYQAAFLLGVRESEDGKTKAALSHLAAAAQAAPGRPDVWHAYALALRKAGQTGEARAAANRALRVAGTPEWEQMALALVESFDRSGNGGQGESGTRRKPEVVTSPAWSRPIPDAEVEGRFVEFVCPRDQPPKFRIEVEGGKIVELNVGDPAQVSILTMGSGESSIELTCGPQNHRPIRAGYRKADGTVLEVKFPQVHDLPRF